MPDELGEIVHSVLEQAFDPPLAALRRDLAERLTRECSEQLCREVAAAREAAATEAGRLAKAGAAEALNLAVRRIRRASSITEIGAALLDTASGYCGRAALLLRRGDFLAGWRACGFAVDGAAFADAWAGFQVPIASAPALAQAIETREAVVSLGLSGHLSPALVEVFASPADEKAYLFPLSLRQNVIAILYADRVGATEGVQAAALELLCAVAEAAIEVVSTRPAPPAEGEAEEAKVERLRLPLAPSPAANPPDWDLLSPADREQHMRAQRFARVLVADLQLYRAAKIREGRRERNLYGLLKDEIDKSREVYQRKFGQTAAGDIDYFHVELAHTLACDDEALLGPDYPGPLVGPTFR
ncbi:MAG TPA: hypothetical protein VEU62_05875 [Bryobacterales bacterium]|nr:hypothetical protein [Bryobacterales bacterium]